MEPRRYACSPALRDQCAVLVWVAPAVLVLFLAAGFLSPPKPRDRIAFGALVGFAAAAIPFAIWAKSVFNATIELDDETITYRRGPRAVVIPWRDVRDVQYRALTERVNVLSTSGAVIHVQKQFIGFEEIVDGISRKTGRSVLPRNKSPVRVADVEISIAAPRWFAYAFLLFLPVSAYYVCLRFLVEAWRQQRWFLAAAGALGAWFLFPAARTVWFQLGTRLRMDATGIAFKSRETAVSIAWPDIKDARIEYLDGVAWFVVRDSSNEPVLTLRREMFNWTNSTMKQFDRLVEAARQRSSVG